MAVINYFPENCVTPSLVTIQHNLAGLITAANSVGTPDPSLPFGPLSLHPANPAATSLYLCCSSPHQLSAMAGCPFGGCEALCCFCQPRTCCLSMFLPASFLFFHFGGSVRGSLWQDNNKKQQKNMEFPGQWTIWWDFVKLWSLALTSYNAGAKVKLWSMRENAQTNQKYLKCKIQHLE